LTVAQQLSNARFESWLDAGRERRQCWEDGLSIAINLAVDGDGKEYDKLLTGKSSSWNKLKSDVENWGYNVKGLRIELGPDATADGTQNGTKVPGSGDAPI
jgi:hypothetical protein